MPLPVKIGFVVLAEKSRIVFFPPRPVFKSRSRPISERSVQSCPAVNLFEGRLFEIPSPFDLRLRLVKDRGSYSLHVIPAETRIDDDLIPQFVTLMPQRFWREQSRPTIQIAIPYIFVCDEECYLSQLPPYLEPTFLNFPGVMISGRFPTNIWPRVLNLAIEWCDFDRDLVLTRGRPMCYLSFETTRPSAPIHLRRAKNTVELEEYRKNILDVAKFTSGTFNLLRDASALRPETLLVWDTENENDQ